jgi:2,4-dienoyl-CoA reductase (NADPH2)
MQTHQGAVSTGGVWQPGQIGSLRLPHRLIMGSMHLNLEGRDDQGAALAEFYAERVRGGAGLITTGGAAVSRVGAGGRQYALINEAEHQQRLGRVAQTVHTEGGMIAAQLFHAGRYAFESSFGLTPVAPSAVYSRFSGCMPEAMTEEQIHRTLQDFADAAAVARRLGFDAVEVMASEGYLVNQFLSPVANQRDDHWGGDPARRRNFPLQLLNTIRQAIGELPVIFRISGADLVPGSSSFDEIADFAVALARAGVDAVNVGVGWHEAAVPTVQTLVPQGIWVPYAEKIKDAVRAAGADVPVIASNRVNKVGHADRLLAAGTIDFISMARPFLADPQIVSKARNRRPELINTCIACNEACIDRSLGNSEVSCLVNPRAGRELDFAQLAGQQTPELRAGRQTSESSGDIGSAEDAACGIASDRSELGAEGMSAAGLNQTRRTDFSTVRGRFAVVGAGPAGMEAARALATLGHQVTIYEAEPELGGQFRPARKVPGKRDFGETIRYFDHELDRLGVTVRLGCAITADDSGELAGLDGIVLATGVVPRQPDVAGLDHVLDYHQAFETPERIGERVAIVGGGGIAVDLAHLLSERDQDHHDRQQAGADDLVVRQRRFLAEWGVTDDPAAAPEPTDAITVMRRSGKIGAGMGVTTRWAVVGTIRHHGVQTLTGIGYREITPAGVWIRDADGADELIEADTVIIAAGQEPNDPLSEIIADLDVPYRVIGGAADTTGLNAVRATSQGLEAAYELDAAIRHPVARR